MFKLNSFQDLYRRPILEASLLEVVPKKGTEPENIEHKVIAPPRVKGRPKKTPDEMYFFDLPSDDEFWAIQKVDNMLRSAGDENQLKYIYAQIVLSSLGLIKSRIFSKNKIIRHTNQSKMLQAEEAFNYFIEKYKFAPDTPVDSIKRLFTDEYNKDVINDKLGFNIFDLFAKEKNWDSLAEYNEKMGTTNLGVKILRIYAGLLGYDTQSRQRYLDSIFNVFNKMEDYYSELSDNASEEEVAEHKKRKEKKLDKIKANLFSPDATPEEKFEAISIAAVTDTLGEKYIGSSAELKAKWDKLRKSKDAYLKATRNEGDNVADLDKDINFVSLDELEKMEKGEKKERTPEEDAILYLQVLDSYQNAMEILEPLLNIIDSIQVTLPVKDGEESKKKAKSTEQNGVITPAAFNTFLTDVTRFSGWLHTVGIDKQLEKAEAEIPSTTVFDFMDKINGLLKKNLVPKTINQHITTAIARESAAMMRLFAKELKNKGYTGGITIGNILDYIKNDSSTEAQVAKENLEELYGLTDADLSTENFPTFKNFVTTLYSSFKYWRAWLDDSRKNPSKRDLINDKRIMAAGQVENRLSDVVDASQGKVSNISDEISAGNQMNIDERQNWSENKVKVHLIISSTAVFGKDLLKKLELPAMADAYDFGEVYKKDIQKIIQETRSNLFYDYASDAFKPYLKKVLSLPSEQLETLINSLRGRFTDKIINAPSRGASRQQHRYGQLESRREKAQARLEKNKEKLGLANIAKYGFNKGEQIEDWSKDAAEIKSELDERESGYYSFIVDTADEDLLNDVAEKMQHWLLTKSPQYIVTVSGLEDGHLASFNAAKQRDERQNSGSYYLTRAVNFAIRNKAVITVGFPDDSDIYNKTNAVDIIKKRMVTLDKHLNATALQTGLIINGKNIYITRMESLRKSKPINVTLGDYSVAVEVKSGDEIIKSDETEANYQAMLSLLGHSADSAKIKNLAARAKEVNPKIKLKESTDVAIVEECFATDKFYQPKVKYIPNKDRYKRGYMIQEWRQKLFSK